MRPLFPSTSLSKEEQDLLAVRASSDQQACYQLLASLEGLVFHLARRLAWTKLPVEDRYQLGMLGVLRAIGCFKMDAGHFCWHAMRHAYSQIRRHALVNGPIGHIPYHAAEKERPAYSVWRCVERIAETETDGFGFEDWDALSVALPRLSRNERCILLCRSKGMAYKTIGPQLGISGERVRQIANKAIEKLRCELKASNCS